MTILKLIMPRKEASHAPLSFLAFCPVAHLAWCAGIQTKSSPFSAVFPVWPHGGTAETGSGFLARALAPSREAYCGCSLPPVLPGL